MGTSCPHLEELLLRCKGLELGLGLGLGLGGPPNPDLILAPNSWQLAGEYSARPFPVVGTGNGGDWKGGVQAHC